MNDEEFRSAVFGTISDWGAAHYPDLPLVFENGPAPDEDKMGQAWLDSSIRWYGAQNATIGARPRTRDNGAISLNVFYRESAGTRLTDQILGGLRQALGNRRMGSAVLLAPQRSVPTHLRGWYKTGLLVPFHLDQG